MSSFGGTGNPTAVPLPPPQNVNPALNADFMKMFGGPGGAGSAGIDALTSMAKGVDISGMVKTLTDASIPGRQMGEASLKNSFAATGMGMSTDLMKGISDFHVNQNLQLQDQVSKLTLAGKGLQLGAATTLEETFSNAALATAPSAVVAGGAQNSNLGGSLVGAGASLGSTFAMLAAMGFL